MFVSWLLFFGLSLLMYGGIFNFSGSIYCYSDLFAIGVGVACLIYVLLRFSLDYFLCILIEIYFI
jgi:hypothetical protein